MNNMLMIDWKWFKIYITMYLCFFVIIYWLLYYI